MAWYDESKRHSDAAKGRKTGRKDRSKPKFAFLGSVLNQRPKRKPKKQLYDFTFSIGLQKTYEKGKGQASPFVIARKIANTTGFGFNVRPQQFIAPGFEEKSLQFQRGGMTQEEIDKVKAALPALMATKAFQQEDIYEQMTPIKEMRLIKSAKAFGTERPLGV
jgi:hypothetical protein